MAKSQAPSWLDLRLPEDGADSTEGPGEFERLWRGFMTARVTLGLVLLLLQSGLYVLGLSSDALLVLMCGVYLVATLTTRLVNRPRRLGRTFDPQSISTIGVDVAVFAVLQFFQGQAGINYTPLLALPVLLASVLGSLPLAMGTAAGVSLLLLAQAVMLSMRSVADPTPMFAQAALTGAGCFLIAFLSTQLSARLASEEQRSRRNQLAVRVQRQVNELVIESLTDGVLVVDGTGTVWAANPAAGKLLGPEPAARRTTPFDLGTHAAWRELARLAAASFASGQAQRANMVFNHAGVGPQRVLVRTRMTATEGGYSQPLCVMFLQDQREMEARMRTDKLASMGRMSTAVAHEIRNPLAAIVQANALLEEEIHEPRLKRLTQLVQQNAQRLENIVDEVLNISRVHGDRDGAQGPGVLVNEAVERICRDWAQHAGASEVLTIELCAGNPAVVFDGEHLRRVLINLLDNARRYTSGQRHAIQVSTRMGAGEHPVLGIWSDGPQMEASVERHLFEPFFSSESRSTGLGLYICRELCEGHGATIGFERLHKKVAGAAVEGNEFMVTFAAVAALAPAGKPSDRIPVTPWLQDRP